MRFDGGFLGRAVVMTLDRRLAWGDLGNAAEKFSAAGLPVERFLVGDGVFYDRAEYGWIDVDARPRRQAFNYASAFLRVLSRELNSSASNRPLLYLEDDAELTTDALDLLPKFFAELSRVAQWDVAHIGGNHTVGRVWRLDDHLLKAEYSLDYHAAIIHPDAYEKFLAIEPSAEHTIDGVIAEKQRRGELIVLGMNPPVVFQRPSYSFNEQRWDDKRDRHLVRYW